MVAETDFLPPSVFLRRDPRCGAVRQLGDSYSSNSNKDGPPRAQQNLALSVPYRRASVFVGLPNEGVADQVDEVMDTRLGASAHRSIQAALTHWDVVRARYGWPRLILSDDSERGGKLATFVLYMAEDTNLVGASISNYVWAFRSWLKFQRQLDPIYGVVDWEDFMQGVAVRTWVQAEPRKKVELWWIRGALRRVDRTSFVAVQAAVVMLMLLFTFARSESPLALAFTGENAFNADKQMQVKDVKVVSGAVLVRLKGIKQDPRMQRPEAAGNEDWIVIGDVPGSDFSIMFWVQLLFGFHHGARDQDAPFFVDRDRRRPYLYSKATVDIRALWAAVVGQEEANSCGLHGLRVAGYDAARRGPGGEELAVAQGAWRSTAHRRYDRFSDAEVRGLAVAIVDQLVEPDASNPFPRERPEPQGVPLVSSSSSSLWPQGPPQPRATERSVPDGGRGAVQQPLLQQLLPPPQRVRGFRTVPVLRWTGRASGTLGSRPANAPRGANCLRGCGMTLLACTRHMRATTTSTSSSGGQRLNDLQPARRRLGGPFSFRLGFIPNTHWQLGRMIDVPFGGTISRYGSAGFFSGILHDLASARSRTLLQ